ncbi:helix-turn-helix domain-containing protein [Enterococcus avium]|jgi:transcriptional regulator with XRE-family HTH domain|uniref:Transcriptional regulator n=1 Tax=Enterococcus avium TaxID=33945 RepID=A0A8B5W1X2_ENTAV|nr:helix-turn-helix transcriptional regulator [Enterococcus avium]MDB1728610.1 helix-turn-helix transcriptional regulator [Enterococcus avium]MDB1732693.1 helix-turn-helix transcriptional regulator [Enterococcus avium]TRZ33256.1 transcriptional regulator [Enterococcus avium]
MTTFDRVKELADRQKISIVELEEKLDFGKNSLYRWKNSSPASDKLQKVADYFNVSVDYLLGRTDDSKPIAEHDKGPGTDLMGYFRLNTAGFDPDETEKIEESLIDYTDFLIKKARERKARKNK